MRFILPFLIILSVNSGSACTLVLKDYAAECLAQERWQSLNSKYTHLNLSISRIKGFAINLALGNPSGIHSINENFFTGNQNWQNWNDGQKFLEQINSIYLELNDILKLHKVMFSTTPEAGKLRVGAGETNPKKSFNCPNSIITQKTIDLYNSYDLKSSDGYPLLQIEKGQICEDKNTYSAEITYYKGASMKTELKAWLVNFNDLIERLSNSNSALESTPISSLADMKRWFVAIHPFTEGNEALGNLLIDYARRKLDLPPLILNNSDSYLLNTEDNRSLVLSQTLNNLSFLESCLINDNYLKATLCTSF